MAKTNLEKLVLKTLEDMKAQDIVDMDVTKLTSMTDHMIICTGTSNRHVASIADNVIVAAKEHGFKPIGVEGQTEGEWVLVDLADVIVHIMQASAREFYSLEKLWAATEKVRKTSSKRHAS